jgi:hypothetical protein
MISRFGRQRDTVEFDARIAELSARRERVVRAEESAPAAENIDPEATIGDHLAVAREELSARLGAEIPPERRALLTRGDLAKIVDAAVQTYFMRRAMQTNPLARDALVTDIVQTLLIPDATNGANRRNPHNAAIEAAKAQIQPLVRAHLDVAGAAEMPRLAFEAQLTGWVKELLAETEIQLNFTEQRELVELLIADILGLGRIDSESTIEERLPVAREELSARLATATWPKQRAPLTPPAAVVEEANRRSPHMAGFIGADLIAKLHKSVLLFFREVTRAALFENYRHDIFLTFVGYLCVAVASGIGFFIFSAIKTHSYWTLILIFVVSVMLFTALTAAMRKFENIEEHL